MKLYPTGFAPGKFYETAKIHKMSPKDTVRKLALIVSNMGTATYHLPKYLAKMLLPLGELEYTIKRHKVFRRKSSIEKKMLTFV